MATEKLKFKLELYATMWDKPPVADIKINEKSFFKEEITSTNDKPTIIELSDIQDDLSPNDGDIIAVFSPTNKVCLDVSKAEALGV